MGTRRARSSAENGLRASRTTQDSAVEFIAMLSQMAAPINEHPTEADTQFEQDAHRLLAGPLPADERVKMERALGELRRTSRRISVLNAKLRRVQPIAQRLLCDVIVNGSEGLRRAIAENEAERRRTRNK